MADQDTLLKKPKKFLFDMHSFDDKHQDEEEELEPPPPMFSEDELAAAKESAFAHGKREGLAQAAASREKHVSVIIENISSNFSRLFQQEDARMITYEEEAVRISKQIFEKLFPALNEAGGLEEITRVITQVIKSHQDKPEILIEVQPDYVTDIENEVNAIMQSLHAGNVCTVIGTERLAAGDCRLSWKEGGAIRSAATIAAEISTHLEQLLSDKSLADKALVRDNKDVGGTSDIAENATLPPETPGETPPETEINDE